MTDKDASDKELHSVRQLVLKDIFTGTSANQYTSNVYVTRELLVSSKKKPKPNEKATYCLIHSWTCKTKYQEH